MPKLKKERRSRAPDREAEIRDMKRLLLMGRNGLDRLNKKARECQHLLNLAVDGETLLMHSIRVGDVYASFVLLTDYHVDPCARGAGGKTPLMAALEAPNPQVPCVVVEKLAFLCGESGLVAADDSGDTPLVYALRAGDSQTALCNLYTLVRFGAPPVACAAAASAEQKETIGRAFTVWARERGGLEYSYSFEQWLAR